MIEVEKRFLLTPQEQERLLHGAVLEWEKTYTDTYYDTKDFRITRKDWWLRNRSGTFELKVGQRAERAGTTDTYKELEDDASILQALDIAATELHDDLLREHGYVPFCTLTTLRRHYGKEGFGIDLDVTTSGAYHFSCCEIELMVDVIKESGDAAQRIMRFAERHAVTTRAFRGKVFEYLYQFRPQHYQALVEAGVIER